MLRSVKLTGEIYLSLQNRSLDCLVDGSKAGPNRVSSHHLKSIIDQTNSIPKPKIDINPIFLSMGI